MAKYKYNHVALGGTFDLLHAGHKAFISLAFKTGRFATIGLTSDKMAKSLGKPTYDDEKTRRKNLLLFLKNNRLKKRTKIVILNDIFGITLKDASLEAIVVTRETKKGADQINKKRATLKLKKLALINCSQILAGDKKVISSSRVRSGEISPEGKNYKNILYRISGKHLPDTTREKLKKPFGKIIKISPPLKSKKLISVGDISTVTLLKNGILPFISIVDFQVNRKPAFYNLSQLGFGAANPDIIVKNEAGQISKPLIDAIDKALKTNHSSVILVQGEEDLAAIPALMLAPLGTTVIYGQPQKGAVMVNVETTTKNTLCTLLNLNK